VDPWSRGRFLCVVFVGLFLWSCTLPDRPEREDLWNVPVLGRYSRDGSGASWGVNLLGGLFQRDVDGESSHTHVFPFYFSTRGPGNDASLLVPPLRYVRRQPFSEDSFLLLTGVQKRGIRTIYHPLFPLIRFAPRDQVGRAEVLVFPLVHFAQDGPRHRLRVGDVLGLVKLFDLQWGQPPEPGDDERRVAFELLNVLNLVQLAGGNDLGGYSDFQLLKLLASEKIALYQRHWRHDGSEGRTVFFPLYWHFRNDVKESHHVWPIVSFARGIDWKRWGLLSDMFTFETGDDTRELTLFWFIPISWSPASSQAARQARQSNLESE